MKTMHEAFKAFCEKRPLQLQWQLSTGKQTESYYEDGHVALLRTLFSKSLVLTILEDGKKGVLHLNQFHPDSVEDYVQQARELAQSSQADVHQRITDETRPLNLKRGQLKADRDQIMQRMMEFLDDMQRYPNIHLETAGLSHHYKHIMVGSSAGTFLEEERGYHGFNVMFTGREGDKSSSFNHYGFLMEELDCEILSHPMLSMIFADTQKQIVTESLEQPIQGSVLMSPACVQTMLYYLDMVALSDSSFIDQSSQWKDKRGEKVAKEIFTLRNDHSLIGSSSITDEGYVAEDEVVIEAGILKNVLLSRYAARRTGHEAAADPALNAVIEAGESSLAQMIEETHSGLLMHRFSGGRPDETGNFSGVAKNSFVLREGKVQEALSEVMIRGNLFEMLQNIEAISSEVVNDGGSRIPWIKFKGIDILSK